MELTVISILSILIVVIIIIVRARDNDEEEEAELKISSTPSPKQSYRGMPDYFDKRVLNYMYELDGYIERGEKGSDKCTRTLEQFQIYVNDTYKNKNSNEYKTYLAIYDSYYERLKTRRIRCGTYMND